MTEPAWTPPTQADELVTTEPQQTSLLPRVDPDELVERVIAQNVAEEPGKPIIASVCLFSGGHDSTVVAHRCRHLYDRLAFIDTGTAVPGVRDFVEDYARWVNKPLHIVEAGTAYHDLVMEPDEQGEPYGFPGVVHHTITYNRLKRPALFALRNMLREEMNTSNGRIVFLTGIRRSESARRKARPEWDRRGALIYVNPLIDWTPGEMRAYRALHRIPESDAAAILHRSGECNCGCFASEGERAELRELWPEWWQQVIGSLEKKLEKAGAAAHKCRWGERLTAGEVGDAGPLCSDCQLRLELAA